MIVVKIELWPLGDESKSKEIGRIDIANNLDGDAKRGSYTVVLHKRLGKVKRGIWKRGVVDIENAEKFEIEGFDRIRRGPYDLVYLALRKFVGWRNKKTLDKGD